MELKPKLESPSKYLLIDSDNDVIEEVSEIDYQVVNLSSLSTDPIKIIYHISDLHIENNINTYEEYAHVFYKLFQVIKNDPFDNKVLVITGDILQEGTKLYTETILFTWNFLKELSKYLPIIIIPGNHDINIRNQEKKDGISGITFDRIPEYLEIKYLLNSGLYKYRNLLFCVQSLFDKKKINPKKIKESLLTKIALYHGILNGARSESGFTFNQNRKLSDFTDYQYTLLGDIHAYQFLKPNIAYSGSLICQSYGESDFEHGCIRWDLEDNKHRFIPIENIYRYQIIKVFKNFSPKVDIRLETIPISGKLKVKFMEHLEPEELYNLKSQIWGIIKEKLKKVTITFEDPKKKPIENPKKYNGGSNFEIPYINFLLVEYVKKKFPEKNVEALCIFLLNEIELLTKKKRLDLPWNIVTVKWENMFCYGENNKVDFHPYKSVTGLIGKNSTGKSLFLEIILYLLYGRDALKDATKMDLVNKERKEFEGEIIIDVGGDLYSIKRKGRVSLRTDTKGFDDDLKIELIKARTANPRNCTENTKKETQKFINELIGNCEDLKRINFMLQTGNEMFLSLKRKERKEYLFRVLELNFLEKINLEIRKKLTQLKIDKAVFEKKIFESYENSTENYFSESKFEELEKELEQKKTLEASYLEIKKTLNTEIESLNREIRPSDSLSSFSKPKRKIYEEIRQRKFFLVKIREQLNKLIKKDPKKVIIKCKKKSRWIEKKIAQIKFDINTINSEIANSKKLIEGENKNLTSSLKQMTNDFHIIRDVLEAVKNNRKVDKTQLDKINFTLIDQITNTNEKINRENELLKQIFQEKEVLLIKNDKLSEKNEKLLKKQVKYKNIQLEIKNFKSSKEKTISEIIENQLLLSKSRESEHNIEMNKEIEEKLRNFDVFRQDFENKLLSCVKRKENIMKELEIMKGRFEDFDNSKKQIFKIQSEFDFYKDIFDITSVNGFSYYLLDRFSQEIEEKMNEIFSIYFNKKIRVTLENDAIEFKIVNENHSLCFLMGGCENLLFEIAFRISISKIMKIPLCGTLFIDEHFGVVDFDRKIEIKKIFQIINCYFEKIFVITHDETIKNYVNECFMIEKSHKFSVLNSDLY